MFSNIYIIFFYTTFVILHYISLFCICAHLPVSESNIQCCCGSTTCTSQKCIRGCSGCSVIFFIWIFKGSSTWRLVWKPSQRDNSTHTLHTAGSLAQRMRRAFPQLIIRLDSFILGVIPLHFPRYISLSSSSARKMHFFLMAGLWYISSANQCSHFIVSFVVMNSVSHYVSWKVTASRKFWSFPKQRLCLQKMWLACN